MINRISIVMLWLTFVLVFVVTGCEQRQKEETPAHITLIGPNFVVPDYVLQAIEATGGYTAWEDCEQIEFDAVVTFYQPDGSFYLTQQHYRISPWLDSIHISGTPDAGQLPQNNFPEAILNIVTAPVRFLDKSLLFTRDPNAVRMEGQWYYPIEQDRLISKDIPYWSKVVFYQNRDNSLVDMIWLATADEKEFLAVRGYDYDELQKGGVMVPAKIEVFTSDSEVVCRQRLVKIDLFRK